MGTDLFSPKVFFVCLKENNNVTFYVKDNNFWKVNHFCAIPLDNQSRKQIFVIWLDEFSPLSEEKFKVRSEQKGLN